MKTKIVIVILAVVCAGLLVGLFAVKKSGEEQHVADASSIVDFLRFCPALAATLFPASTLPVSATPLIRGSSIT